MKKRIFCSMVALVGSAMALCFIFITGLLYEHYSNLQTEQLKETANLTDWNESGNLDCKGWNSTV